MYNIPGMNKFAKEFFNSEEEATKENFEEFWTNAFNILNKNDIKLEIKEIYMITSKSDLEQLYNKENKDTSDLDKVWEQYKDIASKHKLYFLTIKDNIGTFEDEKSAFLMITFDNEGNIINDSQIYYLISMYQFIG